MIAFVETACGTRYVTGRNFGYGIVTWSARQEDAKRFESAKAARDFCWMDRSVAKSMKVA